MDRLAFPHAFEKYNAIDFGGMILPLLAASITLEASEPLVSYNRDIRPLLSDRCFACHGPDDGKREGNFRLDVAEGEWNPFRSIDGMQIIKPGSPESSELWKRLTTDDHALQMPPQDSGKKMLTDAQKELIRRWIEQGAVYENFWLFEPPRPANFAAGRRQRLE